MKVLTKKIGQCSYFCLPLQLTINKPAKDMEKLISVLKQFNQERNAMKDKSKWGTNTVAECFAPCAENILLNGYFMVNEEFIIDLGAIELYYHEEEGDIKDYIMYHTNAHPSKAKGPVLKDGFPYFPIGSFHLHQSGIDITFEHPKEKYRVSFLIRSYRVLKDINELNNADIPFDKCSTHLYDDMFYNGISFDDDNRTKVEWKEYKKTGTVVRSPRRNVAEYEITSDKKIQKRRAEINEEEFQKNHDKYIKVKKGEYFLQDMRPWQFMRAGIVEV